MLFPFKNKLWNFILNLTQNNNKRKTYFDYQKIPSISLDYDTNIIKGKDYLNNNLISRKDVMRFLNDYDNLVNKFKSININLNSPFKKDTYIARKIFKFLLKRQKEKEKTLKKHKIHFNLNEKKNKLLKDNMFHTNKSLKKKSKLSKINKLFKLLKSKSMSQMLKPYRKVLPDVNKSYIKSNIVKSKEIVNSVHINQSLKKKLFKIINKISNNKRKKKKSDLSLNKFVNKNENTSKNRKNIQEIISLFNIKKKESINKSKKKLKALPYFRKFPYQHPLILELQYRLDLIR